MNLPQLKDEQFLEVYSIGVEFHIYSCLIMSSIYKAEDGSRLDWIEIAAHVNNGGLLIARPANSSEMKQATEHFIEHFAKFRPGKIITTLRAQRHKPKPRGYIECLLKHLTGDWGNVSDLQASYNDDAVRYQEKIVSRYIVDNDTEIIIDTNSEGTVTTISLAEEYDDQE